MPYIDAEARIRLEQFSAVAPETPGELNYVITRIILRYIQDNGLSYGIANAVVGVLECAKQELYRRVVVPYEEGKLRENGDVYD